MRITQREHLERFAPKERRNTKPTKAQLNKATEIINRVIRRQAVAQGLIDPKKPKFIWSWSFQGTGGGWVEGNCKSDARGEVKKQMHIPQNRRLPVGVTIEKVCPNPGSSMPIAAKVCKSTPQPSTA